MKAYRRMAKGRAVPRESEEEQIASRTTEELTGLKEQIDQGLIEVEQRDGKVFVTVGLRGFRQAPPILPMRRSGS